MKRILALIIFLFLLSFQTLEAKIYECTYKTKTGMKAVSSFNPMDLTNKYYSEMSNALKTGNCRELFVKKYFIDATSCNIQFYKPGMKIANITCSRNNQTALNKLKDIARKDYGYKGP